MMFALEPFPWFLRAGPELVMQRQAPRVLRRLGVARRSEAADCLVDALSWRNWSFLVRTDKEFADHRARMRASALEFRRLRETKDDRHAARLRVLRAASALEKAKQAVSDAAVELAVAEKLCAAQETAR